MKAVLGWCGAALLALGVLAAAVSPDFTPVRAELANAHGFSRGFLNLVVLSSDQLFTHAPVWSFVIVACVLFSLVRQKPDTTKIVPRVLQVAAVGVLLAVALSPFLTPYRVVLAPRTFALCVVLLCAPRLLTIQLLDASHVSSPDRRRFLIGLASAFGAAFFASAMLQTLGGYGGNYSGFLHVSRPVADGAPFLQERPELRQSLIVYDAGYDGQFMYLMAFDPFLQRFADRPEAYRGFVDNPPYRYGRIGFSLLTNIVSAGKAERFPAAMMWLIVAAHAALAACLAMFAARHSVTPLASLMYLAIPGFMSSLMSALPEALAAAGLVAGLLCWEARRPVLAAAAFGCALLVRETVVILLLALVASTVRREDGVKFAATVLAMSLAPICAWRLFVASRFFSDFGWAAIAPQPGDFGAPFGGLFDLWRAAVTGTQPAPEIGGAFTFPLILAAAALLAAALLRIRRGPIEIAAAVYALIAVCLNYEKIWSHLPSGERGTFELFLCLLLLLLERSSRPAWVRQALAGFFVAVGAYTFLVAPDAATARAALLLIR